jgi:hypothetical protein
VCVFVQVCCSLVCIWSSFLGSFVVYIFLVLGHQTLDKVQKYAAINVNTPSSETYRSDHVVESMVVDGSIYRTVVL